MQLRIFLIDDDEPTVRLIALVARDRGHEVYAMSEPAACPLFGCESCQCPRESACGDLLITGNRLAGMSGLDLIERQLRHGCKGAARSKAVLSRTWTDDDLERAERLGCKIFHKPFLVREITDWMDERERHTDPRRRLADLQPIEAQDHDPFS